jgi:hypothetical protein
MIRSKMSEEAIGLAKWLVGIDTGGTFTDLIAFDQMSGSLQRAKGTFRAERSVARCG